jgi:hypothetical protein
LLEVELEEKMLIPGGEGPGRGGPVLNLSSNLVDLVDLFYQLFLLLACPVYPTLH